MQNRALERTAFRRTVEKRGIREELTLHSRLDYIERVHDQGRDDAGAKAGNGLDGSGRKARMAGVGHVRLALSGFRLCCLSSL